MSLIPVSCRAGATVTYRFHGFHVFPGSRSLLPSTCSIVPIAALRLEVRICLAVHRDVAPVRKIAHKADQRRAAPPQVAAYPPQNERHGIEIPVARDHFLDDSVQGQIPISGNRVGQRIELPVFRESAMSDAAFRLHLVPQARTGKGCQKQGIKKVNSLLAGPAGDSIADARSVYVQTDDEGSCDHYVVSLYAAHGSTEIPAL